MEIRITNQEAYKEFTEKYMSNETRCIKCGHDIFQASRTAPNQVLLICAQCSEPHTIDADLHDSKIPVLTFWSPKMDQSASTESRRTYENLEISKGLKEKTIEDLAKDMMEFVEKEFPEDARPPFFTISRLFWLKLGVDIFFLTSREPEFAIKKEKVELIVKKQLEEEDLKKKKQKLLSLKTKVMEWANEKKLKRITQSDVNIFLMMKEIALTLDDKRMLWRLVNLELK